MNIRKLKYPLRFLLQIIIILSIMIFVYNYANGNMSSNSEKENYILYFIVICIIELFSIVYLMRHKTYYAVDETNDAYIIDRYYLTSKETIDLCETTIADHYRLDAITIDFLNALDIILSLPSKKVIQKQIKNKVLNYSKYQIEKIEKQKKILFVNYYKLLLKNGKYK